MTLAAILAALAAAVTHADAFMALGVSFVDLFDKSKALVTSHTASTPDERAAAMLVIEDLEAKRDARLDELGRLAPNS